MARAAVRGRRALVVGFYTLSIQDEPVPASIRKLLDYEMRKAEDMRALAVLGAGYQWLDFPERMLREPFPRHALDMFKLPKGLEGFQFLPVVEDALEELLEAHPRATVMAPLAIGHHFDHAELFLAALKVMLRRGECERFRFYEDAYAMLTPLRKAHFLARRRLWSRLEAPEVASMKMTLMARVIAWAGRNSSLEPLFPRHGRDLDWALKKRAIEVYEAPKLEALAFYESQIGPMGGMKVVGRMLQRYHAIWGGAEPFWKASG